MCLRSVSSRNLSPVSWSEVNCNQPSLHFLPFWKALVFLNVIEPVPGKSLTQTLFQKLPQVKRQGFLDHLILQIKYGSRRKHGVIQRTVLNSKQKVLLSSSEAWLGLRNPKIWYCTQLSMRPRQLAKAKKFKGKKKKWGGDVCRTELCQVSWLYGQPRAYRAVMEQAAEWGLKCEWGYLQQHGWDWQWSYKLKQDNCRTKSQQQ